MSANNKHENAKAQAHDHAHEEEAHEGPIKTPKQLAWAVLFAFVAPVIVIILLANYVTSASKPAAGSEALEAMAVAARIQPVLKEMVASSLAACRSCYEK